MTQWHIVAVTLLPHAWYSYLILKSVEPVTKILEEQKLLRHRLVKRKAFGPIRLLVLYPNSSQSLRTLLVLRKQQKYMYYYGEIELLYNLVLFILILLEL